MEKAEDTFRNLPIGALLDLMEENMNELLKTINTVEQKVENKKTVDLLKKEIELLKKVIVAKRAEFPPG